MPLLSHFVRFGSLSVMAVVATMGITACGLFGENNSFGVRTGDCFDQDAPASVSASEVEVVDCSEPHEFEVFHVEELPKGDFPGEAAVSAAAVEACEGRTSRASWVSST